MLSNDDHHSTPSAAAVTSSRQSTNSAVNDIEEGFPQTTNEAANDGSFKQIEDVVHQKWNCITCAVVVMGLSITFFGSDIIHSLLRSPLNP